MRTREEETRVEMKADILLSDAEISKDLEKMGIFH